MAVLEHLEPKKVFHYFEEICNIPHPSYKEKKISDYLVNFAKEHGLEHYQDDLYNVVMIAPATAGYENEEPVILQGHMDMVCEKAPGVEIDFENEGLKLLIDGDYVTADGTTLGGDDGIAIAYALAILDSPEIAHPRLEVIITVSEEVGMEGATGIDLSMLQGHKVLNLDSEAEGVMTVSCAGGNSSICHIPMNYEAAQGTPLTVAVKGLKGGHSGVEIDKGRANANLVMGRLLLTLDQAGLEYGIASMAGGAKQNAIPREATAAIVTAPEKKAAVISCLQETIAQIKKEYATTDPDLTLEVSEQAEAAQVLTKESKDKAVLLLNNLPGGIQAMSADIEGLVETSLNMGVVVLDEKELRMEFAVRSSLITARDAVTARIRNMVEFVGGTLDVNGIYPAWEYKKDSVMREDAARIFEQMYGKAPKIEAIHAGLECGILAGKIKDLDGISIGPDMIGIHTFEEKLSISSTKRVYEFVLEVLKCKH
ncbi:MAG: aminoacyl-histidine dipeptidase [bacterium]|nr:aminoacyl-histidine dipeptidase [bacterium]MDY4100239.1 aminoacyl-histidine dipeptidase [Lachnospiraceae bacterium]